MYSSAPGVFWYHLTFSSSHLLLSQPPQEKVVPVQGFISHQINRSKWSNSSQPIYFHFPKGSYHLFLSLMLASQQQIRRFSLEHATDCSWETKSGIPGRLWQTMPHCGNENLDTTAHLSCDLHKDTVWDSSKKRIFTIFAAISRTTDRLSYAVSPSCQWHSLMFSKPELILVCTLLQCFLPGVEKSGVNLSSQLLEQTFSCSKVGREGQRGKIYLILGTVCTWGNLMTWKHVTKLMIQEVASREL